MTTAKGGPPLSQAERMARRYGIKLRALKLLGGVEGLKRMAPHARRLMIKMAQNGRKANR